MATVEQLTIEFRGKGAPRLTGQLNSLSAAMNRLAARQIEATKKTKDSVKVNKQYGESLVRNHRNMGNLNGMVGKFGKQMSMMRSRMLIVAFAVGLVTKALGNLMKQFSEYAKLNFKINAILKSTGNTAGITAKQLDDMANQMEASLGFSSTQLKEMQTRLLTFTNIVGSTFKKASIAAADMAAVFGQDLSQATIQLGKALNDPIKGYTALRRIGVSFDALQVRQIKNFQEQGKIIEAQNVILSELAREFGGAAKAATKAAYGNEQLREAGNQAAVVMRALGEALQPVAYLLGRSSEALLKWVMVTPNAIKATGKLVLKFYELVFGLRDVNKEFAIAEISENISDQVRGLTKSFLHLTDGFRASVVGLEGWTKVSETGAAAGEVTLAGIQNQIIALKEQGGSQEDINKLLADFAERMVNNKAILASFTTQQDDLVSSSDKLIKSMESKNNLLAEELRNGKKLNELDKMNIKLDNELINLSDETKRALLDEAFAMDTYNEEIKRRVELEKQTAEELKKRDKIMKDLTSAAEKFFNAQIEQERSLADARIEIIEEAEQRELDRIRNTWAYKKATDTAKQKMEEAVTAQFKQQKEEETKIANEAIKKQFKNKQLLQAGEAIMATAKGVTEAGNPAHWWMIPMIIANGILQLGIIKAQKAPTMRYGGAIGGEPHSRGGTMINAERGEFVMRREAVEAVGIETMNRINEGRSASAVNISFSGNVLSDDFIIDEALPKIKEAIRRGADIGIG